MRDKNIRNIYLRDLLFFFAANLKNKPNSSEDNKIMHKGRKRNNVSLPVLSNKSEPSETAIQKHRPLTAEQRKTSFLQLMKDSKAHKNPPTPEKIMLIVNKLRDGSSVLPSNAETISAAARVQSRLQAQIAAPDAKTFFSFFCLFLFFMLTYSKLPADVMPAFCVLLLFCSVNVY